MKTHSRLIATTVALSLLLLVVSLAPGVAQQKAAPGAAPAQKAGLPVLLTSCGQSPGPTRFDIFLKKLKMDYVYKLDATAADLTKAGAPFKSVIIVTGASLKGMGAAGVSIDDEIARIRALIAAAKKANIKVIGAHIEGMTRRAQGAAPGDNSDELTIDAVCPQSSLLIVKKEGDEDGRFTTISKGKNIPMISYEKNMDLENVLKDLFGK
ncbi:MAG: DUF6305 family protein [Acidobacteriia bacterium]|nr:DUF6305 family protein [Terriglobia bacterium]